MPEYLAPGVYIEETSYRARSIEGVATSTAGFVGPCRYGPSSGKPRLVTSFEEFLRLFGGVEDLSFGANYMAHAVRAFFDNGGRRVYIARVHKGATVAASAWGLPPGADSQDPVDGIRFWARYPGAFGNLVVRVRTVRGVNALKTGGLTGLHAGDLVEVVSKPISGDAQALRSGAIKGNASNDVKADKFRIVTADAVGRLGLATLADPPVPVDETRLSFVHRLTVDVSVQSSVGVDSYTGLSVSPLAPDFIGTVLGVGDDADPDGKVVLAQSEPTVGSAEERSLLELSPAQAADLFLALLPRKQAGVRLLRGSKATTEVATADGVAIVLGKVPAAAAGGAVAQGQDGTDGGQVGSDEIAGAPGAAADPSGLLALELVDDIAIVAAPGSSSLKDDDGQAVRDVLLSHCERLKYRFAILAAERSRTVDTISDARAEHDSPYGALYFPWVSIANPLGDGTLDLPPEGFMAGIYARSDIERGVHKAPANEVVRGALRFSVEISTGQQEVLNPAGINCLRFFEGRGYRVWGARTISSDSEWRYINVRRLFIFLEHSIDRATQWVVFEPNNETLWLKVRLTIESFLEDVWRTGALLGKTPKEAYFVRCDRTTMTQSDLDNGRLIVLIGVAPTKPAEFVIFRIGQFTADASIA